MKEAWNLIGYTSRRLGDYEASLTAYDKALALAPDYPEAIEYRAELFLLTGRFEQVRTAYAQLLQGSPSYAGVLKTSLQEWVAQKDAPGSKAAGRDAFAAWVATL
jgi:tetratricopeptide (TPR) repeat protein